MFYKFYNLLAYISYSIWHCVAKNHAFLAVTLLSSLFFLDRFCSVCSSNNNMVRARKSRVLEFATDCSYMEGSVRANLQHVCIILLSYAAYLFFSQSCYNHSPWTNHMNSVQVFSISLYINEYITELLFCGLWLEDAKSTLSPPPRETTV
jgi:hypothetical protein